MSEILDCFINFRAEQKLGFVFLSKAQRLSYIMVLSKKHSLCLKANAEMAPKIPSCHYMLLM